MKKHPVLFALIRTVFGVVFLIVRIYMFVPRLYYYLQNQYLLFSTHPFLPYRVFMAVAWLSSFFLLLLQFYWGSLIIKGGLRGIGLLSSKSKKKKAV